MPSPLQISVIVNGSQVATGMSGVTTTVEAATAQIKAAFGTVANAPAGIQNALLVLQNQARMTGPAIQTATQAIAALGAAGSAAAPAVNATGAAAASTATQMTSMDRAMALATGRMAGMAAGAGMLGGALGRVAAASSALGPILAAAFPVIAVAAFADIAFMAYEKIIDFTSALAGWDKEAQKMYDLLIGLNQQTVGFNANLAIEKLRLGEIGLKGSALDLQKEKDLKGELAIRTDELTASLQRENSIRTELQGKSRTETHYDPTGQGMVTQTVIDKPSKDVVTRLNTELSEAIKNSQRLAEEILKLQQVSIPGEAKKDEADRAKELAKQTERASEAGIAYFKAMERAKEQAQGLTDKVIQLALEQSQFGAQQDAKGSGSDLKDLEERQSAERQFQQDRLSDQKQAALTEIDIQQDKVKELARLDKITTEQEVQQLNDLEAKKFQIEQAYLQERINTILARLNSDNDAAYAEDAKEWSKLLSEKQKAEDTYLKNRQKNTDGAATTEENTWKKLTTKINQSFDQSITGLISGTERFGTAFARLFDSLLSQFVSFLAKQALKWAENHLLMLAEHSSFLANILGLETANNAAKQAQQSVAAVAAVTSQAGIAGAAGFASVMASVPFPLNVAMAPEVAAAAIAATLSNISLASAAGGWDVPSDSLAMVHQDEMILPANISSGLKNLIGGGGTGGDVHLNYSVGNVNAIDARGMEDVLSKHGAALTKALRRELRRSNAI
jgi:hypothetical protein